MPRSPMRRHLHRRAAPLLALTLALASAPACGSGRVADVPAAAPEAELRVMTFNVRWGTAPDGDDAWPHRRDLLMRTIEHYDPHVLGVQEALRFQLDEMHRAFDDPGEVGVGRDDGVEAGEYSAILYDRARLTLLDQGTYWLSDTPDVPGSMTWGNKYPRLVTWARFEDRATGASFRVLNTHWDHEVQLARERGARQIVRWLTERVGDAPVIVMGDFNAGPTNPAFRTLLEAGAAGVRLSDTWARAHPGDDPVGTYHAFTGDRTGEKIDAVLASPAWEVLEAEIVTVEEGGRYPSDHFPVTATLLLRGTDR